MQSSEEILIGTGEAAEILDVNRATVLRWAASGELPFVRKLPGENGAVLFDGAAVRRKAAELLVQRAAKQARRSA